MTQRSNSVGNRPVFSEDAVLTAIADELNLIKSTDRLTWDDVAAVLGCSDVQAAKYADAGSRTKMNVVTFGRAKREWNGRFTGAFDRLCVESRPTSDSDRTCGSKVLAAALAMSVALEGDGEMVSTQVRANRATLEQARDAIDAQLAKLSPRGVRA